MFFILSSDQEGREHFQHHVRGEQLVLARPPARKVQAEARHSLRSLEKCSPGDSTFL